MLRMLGRRPTSPIGTASPIDSFNDGAMEEGSPMIPVGTTHRYSFTPDPTGTRWYHTHASAFDNLAAGGYTGQFGFLLIEGKEKPAHYDQEINLAIHHWEPSFVPMVETMREQSANMPLTTGSDVGYKYATINAHSSAPESLSASSKASACSSGC